jgi:hypothetical protein
MIDCMKIFHTPRYRSPSRSPFQRLWQFHDDHPLPPRLNRAARACLYVGRRLKHAVAHRKRYAVRAEGTEPKPVPRNRFLEARPFSPLPFEDAAAWFRRVHEANETVYRGNGSWFPQPYALSAGHGISIEEVALRIPGYLSAYKATAEPSYLERANAGGEYLLRERLFTDGHLLLQGHLTIDFCYTFAGAALLALWERDRKCTEYFEAARKIGDRLVECHLAGSINHGSSPAQLLGPLYRHTGDRRYLRAAVRRVFRRAVPFQLPSGGWVGHEGRLWYQGINLRSLIAMYVAMPFTLEYARKKDRLAQSIVAATNWFLSLQSAAGAFPLSGDPGLTSTEWEQDVVTFDGCKFLPEPMVRAYFGHGAYEIDALVAAYEHLQVEAVLPALHGYASLIAGTRRLWRLEFNTLGAGRYLGLLADLAAQPAASRSLQRRWRHHQEKHRCNPLVVPL